MVSAKEIFCLSQPLWGCLGPDFKKLCCVPISKSIDIEIQLGANQQYLNVSDGSSAIQGVSSLMVLQVPILTRFLQSEGYCCPGVLKVTGSTEMQRSVDTFHWTGPCGADQQVEGSRIHEATYTDTILQSMWHHFLLHTELLQQNSQQGCPWELWACQEYREISWSFQFFGWKEQQTICLLIHCFLNSMTSRS